MTDDACRKYLEDPEAFPGHLDECVECSALFGVLDEKQNVASARMSLDALPLAPWEGASHRPWGFIAAAAIALVVLASVLFIASGAPPLTGIASAIRGSVPSRDLIGSMLNMASGAAQNAPFGWRAGVGAAFVVVNVILFAFLRRDPKGLDV